MHPFSGIIVKYRLNEGVDRVALDELHINLWEVGPTFLDIGVMISQPQEIKSIEVLLPWTVQRNDVQDLGFKLDSATRIAAIFNSSVEYHSLEDRPFAKVYFRSDSNSANDAQSGERNFVLARLSNDNFEVTPVSDGLASQISVTFPANAPFDLGDAKMPANKLYVRFRIHKVPAGFYEAKFSQPDRNILSSHIETRIVDFRINVRRGMPDIPIVDSAFPNFSKIHFFLTVERSNECLFYGTDYIGCRSLMDEDVWNQYVRYNPSTAIKYSVKNYLGYQWTKSAKEETRDKEKITVGVKDLVALGRFSKTSAGVARIFVFLGFGLMFSFSGNAFWEVLKYPESHTFSFLTHTFKSNFVLAVVSGFFALIMIFAADAFLNLKRKPLYQAVLNKIIRCLERLRD